MQRLVFSNFDGLGFWQSIARVHGGPVVNWQEWPKQLEIFCTQTSVLGIITSMRGA
jgi:hypothetical protein